MTLYIPKGRRTRRGFAPTSIARNARESEAPWAWRGATSVFPVFTGGLQDQAHPRTVALQPGASDALPKRIVTGAGPAYRCNSSKGRTGSGNDDVESFDYESNTVQIESGSDFTFWFAGYINALNGSNAGFFRTGDSAEGDTFCIFNGSDPIPWIRWAGTDILKIANGADFTLGEFVTLVFVVRSAQDAEFWVNGELKRAATHITATPSRIVRYVGFQFGEQDWIEGDYLAWGFADRAWGRSDSEALHNFDMFRRRPLLVPVSSGGGTGVS